MSYCLHLRPTCIIVSALLVAQGFFQGPPYLFPGNLLESTFPDLPSTVWMHQECLVDDGVCIHQQIFKAVKRPSQWLFNQWLRLEGNLYPTEPNICNPCMGSSQSCVETILKDPKKRLFNVLSLRDVNRKNWRMSSNHLSDQLVPVENLRFYI